MFTGQEIVEIFERLEITHVVWIPDTTIGRWEPQLAAAKRLKLVRVCREGDHRDGG